MRAVDAGLPEPRIGTNIGGTPDVLAATLAGEEGFAILDAMTDEQRQLLRSKVRGGGGATATALGQAATGAPPPPRHDVCGGGEENVVLVCAEEMTF